LKSGHWSRPSGRQIEIVPVPLAGVAGTAVEVRLAVDGASVRVMGGDDLNPAARRADVHEGVLSPGVR